MNELPSENIEGVKNFRRFFAFLAVLLVIIGQLYVYTTPARENIQDIPTVFWVEVVVIGLGVLLFSWSQNTRPGTRMLAFVARMHFSRITFSNLTALVLSLLAVFATQLFSKANLSNYIPVVTLWLCAGIVYVAGLSPALPSFTHCREWLKAHWRELLAIGLITLLALVLRFYRLGEVPKVVNGDEGRIGLAALSTVTGMYANPFSLWENFGALYLQGINFFFNILCTSTFALRLLPAIGGILAIPAVYLLARQVTGQKRIALIAAALLAYSHTHMHFSRTVAVAYIQGTWLIPLELYLLLSGLEKRSSWRTALAGILLAIHYSIYLDAQIVTGLVLVYMLIAFLFLRSWFRPAVRQALAFWGGFGLMILPELFYILQNQNTFFDRMGNNGLIQSGWLAREVARVAPGADALQGALATAGILAWRVGHAFLSLIYYPSFDFYGSPQPILSVLAAVLFLVGLGIALRMMRYPGYLLLNGYFWAGTLSVGLFAIPVSADTYRMLIVLPAALLLAAIGLDRILNGLGADFAHYPLKYAAAVSLILGSLLIYNLWAYYFDFAGRCLYGNDDAPTRYASYLGNYTGTLPRDTEVYLLSDSVYFYGSHGSVDFLSHNHPITNVNDPAETLQIRPDEVIISTPDREEELRAWADTHPGGKLESHFDCTNNIMLTYQFP